MVREQIKAPLACVWNEEWFYAAGSVSPNSVGSLADGIPWVSMPLSQNGFAMLTHVTFPAFGLFTNVHLTLLSNWLLTLYA